MHLRFGEVVNCQSVGRFLGMVVTLHPVQFDCLVFTFDSNKKVRVYVVIIIMVLLLLFQFIRSNILQKLPPSPPVTHTTHRYQYMLIGP